MYCGVAAQVPEYVSKAKLAWFGSHSRPEACLPLFREAVKSQSPADVHHMSTQCVTVTKNSYVHGVCFSDIATLDRWLVVISIDLNSLHLSVFKCMERAFIRQ